MGGKTPAPKKAENFFYLVWRSLFRDRHCDEVWGGMRINFWNNLGYFRVFIPLVVGGHLSVGMSVF